CKRAQCTGSEAESSLWFPWHDKITCTLDVLMHLPWSVFSQRQLDLFLWLLRVNDVDDVPSVKTIQSLNAALQKMCGIETIPYKGALRHNYHEMSNLQVRPHLHFYPEDQGDRPFAEARQASRWLNEVPNELVTPMARIHNHDYYIYKPAMLVNGVCIAEDLWYTDYHNTQSGITGPWTLTDPWIGNRWHAIAKGHRVVSFAMWMYCDNTSGNLSKKWNAHNSFLFTVAGLPRVEAQKEYNVHFLATSNLAPPLEMLDGIVEQLQFVVLSYFCSQPLICTTRDAQNNGIWTWDCSMNEPVLMIPFVLAMLGDNLMQSKFACHIGLHGKLFCRACWVCGKDAAGNADLEIAQPDVHAQSPSVVSDAESDVSAASGGSNLDGNMGEGSVSSPGKLWHKDESIATLHSYFTKAKTLHSKTHVAKMRTEMGVKDSYQLHFLDKLFSSHKNKCSETTKQVALDQAIASLLQEIMSPIWRLDPHQDTPVEILHMVLLGFVKYLWCDAVQNQLKSQEDKKALVATWLTDLDVSSLGLSTLAGQTLVQYSGSLTGRNFCAITQTAGVECIGEPGAELLAVMVGLGRND
ncbi:hypothetical protein POSPLADRAFT_1148718, partial [Postia placenta MAD-698-R-SB12]